MVDVDELEGWIVWIYFVVVDVGDYIDGFDKDLFVVVVYLVIGGVVDGVVW